MELNQLASNQDEGPYKATMLWAAAVRGFREGMAVQRHWRQLRSHDRCFTASAAVAWLQRYLSQHALFAADVSRQQTIRLLAKFVQAGIMVPVRPQRKGAAQFGDDSRLYRLSTHGTPGRSALTLINGSATEPAAASSPELRRRPYRQPSPTAVLSPRSPQQLQSLPFHQLQPLPAHQLQPLPAHQLQPLPVHQLRPLPVHQLQPLPVRQLPQCRPVMRSLSAAEVDAVWSSTLLARLELLLDAPAVDIVPAGCVVAAWIRHNTTCVDQRGLVEPTAADQPALPHWLLLAMKSLANWPQQQPQMTESPLGDYVGFQRDVLCVIAEYFAALPFPLVPQDLCDPLLAAFLHAERVDVQLRHASPSAAVAAPKAAASSVENLLLMMSPSAPSSSTPKEGPAAAAPPPDTPLTALRRGDGRYQHFKDDSLFALPAPVTPARESVAQLRRRLMRLGIGWDGESDGGEPPHRARAASFLRAIADGKENTAPAIADRFCRAVFRPPVEAASDVLLGRQSASPPLTTGAPPPSPPSPPTAGFIPSTSSLQSATCGPSSSSLQSAICGPSLSSLQSAVNGPSLSSLQSAIFGTSSSSLQTGVYGPSSSSLRCAAFGPSTSSLQPAKYVATSTLQPTQFAPTSIQYSRGGGPCTSSPYASGCNSSTAGPCSEGQQQRSSVQSTGRMLSASSATSGAYQPQASCPLETRLSSAGTHRAMSAQSRPTSGQLLSCPNLQAGSHRSWSSVQCGRTPASTSSLSSASARHSSTFSARLSVSGADSSGLWPLAEANRSDAHASRDSVFAPAGSPFDSAVGSSVASERSADTCLETVFGAAGPVTRLIAQRSVEALHLPTSRSGSRLSQAAADSTDSLADRGRAASLQASIRRHHLRDDSLSRSVKRLKERHRDGRRQRRRLDEHDQQAAADYAAFSSGLSHASDDSAQPAAGRTRSQSVASEADAGPPSVLKAARVLGVAVEQVERAAAPPLPLRLHGPAALRVWQRRSVADPSRVTQPPLSPLQQAARQRRSVVGRDYENVRDLVRATTEPVQAPPRPAYVGRFRATPHLITADGHKLARETLQLLLTLLPPSCRRQLQLLLQFMHKVAGNQRLQLGHPAGTRALMISTFANRILSQPDDDGSDAVVVRRLVGYLMDHHSEIVAPAELVRDAVTDRVQQLQQERVQFGPDTPATFCEMISPEEYGRSQTSKSLLSLLDVIIADACMSRKDKRKKLKQFRETYPGIYSQRLQEAERELVVGGGKQRTRSLFSGSLSSLVRSKSLRI